MPIKYFNLYPKDEKAAEASVWYKCPDIQKVGELNGDKILYSPCQARVFLLDEKEYKKFTENESFNTSNELVKNRLFLSENFNTRPQKEEEKFNNISIFLTTDCNLGCVYCYADAGVKQSVADPEMVKRALVLRKKQVGNDLPTFILFQGGGESTLAFDLIKEIVGFTKQLEGKYGFGIQTNGVISDQTLDYLIKNKFSVCISCDGPPEIQDVQRPLPGGGKTSVHVEKTIKKLVKSGSIPSIRATISNYSVNQMCETVEYLNNLGIQQIQFEPIFETGRCMQNKDACTETPDFNKFQKYFIKAKELSDEYGIMLISTFLPLYRFSQHSCGCSTPNFCITTDGFISACNSSFTKDADSQGFIYGQVGGTLTLDNEKINSLKARTAENISGCSQCFLKWNCSGGCAMQSIEVEKDINKPIKQLCTVRKKISQKYIKNQLLKLTEQVPYIEIKEGQLFFNLAANSYELTPCMPESTFQKNPYIALSSQTNFEKLLSKINDYREKRHPQTTLFLFAFETSPLDDTQTGKKIIKFLKKLREKRVYSKFTKPLPRCLFDNPLLTSYQYGIPLSCRQCIELYRKKDGQLILCNGIKSRSKDRQTIIGSQDFKNNFSQKNKCNACEYYAKKQCLGYCQVKNTR